MAAEASNAAYEGKGAPNSAAAAASTAATEILLNNSAKKCFMWYQMQHMNS